MWLQNPTFPVTHEHEALTTSPDKIHGQFSDYEEGRFS